MATAFHNAALAAHNAVRRNRGLAVTYRRGEASVAITAVPAATRVEVSDGSGVAVRATRRDWLVRAADLVLDGETVGPEVGDRIEMAAGDGGAVFEVQRLAGEGHVQACDALGAVLRVHTRQVEAT